MSKRLGEEITHDTNETWTLLCQSHVRDPRFHLYLHPPLHGMSGWTSIFEELRMRLDWTSLSNLACQRAYIWLSLSWTIPFWRNTNALSISSACSRFEWKEYEQHTWIQMEHFKYLRLHSPIRRGKENLKRLFFYLLYKVTQRICVQMYVRASNAPSSLLRWTSLGACETVIQKETYLMRLCSPIQVIQMIWTLSNGADGHYRAYICNLLPFKCILEKKTISLIEHIHPGGQTATVMNTTLSENYSVLYPAVVEDEKGSDRHIETHARTHTRTLTHTHTHAYTVEKQEKPERGNESKCAFPSPINL